MARFVPRFDMSTLLFELECQHAAGPAGTQELFIRGLFRAGLERMRAARLILAKGPLNGGTQGSCFRPRRIQLSADKRSRSSGTSLCESLHFRGLDNTC